MPADAYRDSCMEATFCVEEQKCVALNPESDNPAVAVDEAWLFSVLIDIRGLFEILRWPLLFARSHSEPISDVREESVMLAASVDSCSHIMTAEVPFRSWRIPGYLDALFCFFLAKMAIINLSLSRIL